MMTEQSHQLSRRQFLKAAAVIGAGSALAACVAPSAAPAGEAAAPAVNTGAKQTVRYLSWWFEEGKRGETWLAFVKEFNESLGQSRVRQNGQRRSKGIG